MMTKSKFNQGSKLRVLTLIPLAIVIFIAVACVNGHDKSNVVTAVEPVRMNVLYIGVDNPVKIAASGYKASDLIASIDNGTISGKDGEYVIQPKEQGTAIVTVSSNGREIQKTTFRVKVIPDPVAKVAGLRSGLIKKDVLLNTNELMAVMENFDFDLNFEIVEFTMSAERDEKYFYEYKSNSNKFTEEVKRAIAKTSIGSRITFEQIKCKGPDGSLRAIAPIIFKITE